MRRRCAIRARQPNECGQYPALLGAVIPGNGLGKEVIPATVGVLQALTRQDGGFELKFDSFDWGSDSFARHARMMPGDGRELIRHHDAIRFGAAGSPGVPDHISLWGAFASPSVNPSANTPMYGRSACCEALSVSCGGSSSESSIE